MTQSMETQTMLPAQHEDVEDKRKALSGQGMGGAAQTAAHRVLRCAGSFCC